MDRDKLHEFIAENAESVYEDAPCGFIFTDPDGKLLWSNRTFTDWTGLSFSEILDKRLPELLAVGSRIYYETNYSPLLRMQGFLSEIALDLRGPNGANLPVLISSREMRDEDGKPVLIRSTVFNITERRSYERELLRARKDAESAAIRMKLLAASSEHLRSSHDIRKHAAAIVELAVEEFCDLAVIEIPGEQIIRVSAGRGSRKLDEEIIDLPRLSDTILIETVDEYHPHPGFEKIINSVDPQSLIVSPIGEEGHPKGWIWMFHTDLGRRFNQQDSDLGRELARSICRALETAVLEKEKLLAEKELYESHEWFSTTLRSIGDAVIAVTPDRAVEYLNQVAVELTGWTLEEARGRSMEEVFRIVKAGTDIPAFNPVSQVLKEGIIVGLHNDTALIRKDNSRIIIEDSASPIKDKEGVIRGVVLVFRDTTLRHQEELERRALLTNLQTEKELREKFVATLTHDLRSPLTAAKLSAQLLGKHDLKDTQKLEILSRMTKNLNRVDGMIQDLLDVNRLRAGIKLDLEKEFFDFTGLAGEVVNELSHIHGPVFKLVADKEVTGKWNRESMQRILENLMNNAIKYGEKNGLVTVTISSTEETAIVSVHNTGNPIPGDEIALLFDPYQRLKSAGDQKGWGLGLTLVKGVAEAHHGYIEVTSTPEDGTTFTILLPRR